jgi:hypothetical protein
MTNTARTTLSFIKIMIETFCADGTTSIGTNGLAASQERIVNRPAWKSNSFAAARFHRELQKRFQPCPESSNDRYLPLLRTPSLVCI